jgi:hypothetical protein
MTKTIDLRRLQNYFAPGDIEWKPLRYTKDRKRAMAAPYITNRAIMDRLDEVCGPENWRNEFRQGPDGGVLCGISLRLGSEWVTKWDGASNTEIEAVKGGLSSSMRRAAVQWGIGRYLYRLPPRWQAVDARGRFLEAPALPPALHPSYSMCESSDRPASLRPATVASIREISGSTRQVVAARKGTARGESVRAASRSRQSEQGEVSASESPSPPRRLAANA